MVNKKLHSLWEPGWNTRRWSYANRWARQDQTKCSHDLRRCVGNKSKHIPTDVCEYIFTIIHMHADVGCLKVNVHT